PVHEEELDLLALGRARAGREVDRYHAEIAEIRLQITPFRVDILDAQAALDPVGDAAGIDADAAVAFSGCAVVVRAEAARYRERFQVVFLRLELLHADHVGALPREPGERALGRRGTDSVEVEGDCA